MLPQHAAACSQHLELHPMFWFLLMHLRIHRPLQLLCTPDNTTADYIPCKPNSHSKACDARPLHTCYTSLYDARCVLFKLLQPPMFAATAEAPVNSTQRPYCYQPCKLLNHLNRPRTITPYIMQEQAHVMPLQAVTKTHTYVLGWQSASTHTHKSFVQATSALLQQLPFQPASKHPQLPTRTPANCKR
jgi:hypothetical protein